MTGDMWHILEAVSPVLLAVLVAWYDLRTGVTRLETKIEPIWKWWNERQERREKERT
jgi:hypothetical protein